MSGTADFRLKLATSTGDTFTDATTSDVLLNAINGSTTRAILAGFSSSVSGTIGPSALRISSNAVSVMGGLGVGTSNPLNTLDVIGNASFRNSTTTTMVITQGNNTAVDGYWKFASIMIGPNGISSGGMDIEGSFSQLSTLYSVKFNLAANSTSPATTAYSAYSEVTSSGSVPTGKVILYLNTAVATAVSLDVYIFSSANSRASFTFRGTPTNYAYFNSTASYGSAPTITSTYAQVYDTSVNSTLVKSSTSVQIGASTTVYVQGLLSGCNATFSSQINAGSLSVVGNSLLTGSVTTGSNLVITGDLTANGNTYSANHSNVGSMSYMSNIVGTGFLNVGGSLSALSNVVVASGLAANGGLSVNGSTAIDSSKNASFLTLNVAGNTSMTSNVTVGSNLTVAGTVNVTGKTISYGLLSASNGLMVSGLSALSNTTNTGTLTVSNLLTANGGLTVNGSISVGATPTTVIDSSANGTFLSMYTKSLSNAGPLYVSGGDYRSDNNGITTMLLSAYNNSTTSNFWKIASVTSTFGGGNSGGIDIQGSFSRADSACDIKFQSTADVYSNNPNITAVSEISGSLTDGKILMYYNTAVSTAPVLDYYVFSDSYSRASFLFRASTSSLSNFTPICVYGNSNGPTVSSTYTQIYDTSTMSLVTKTVGQFSIFGALNVNGSASVSSNLTVGSNMTINGNLTTNGNTYSLGRSNVLGTSYMSNSSTSGIVTCGGTLSALSNVVITGGVAANGGVIVNASTVIDSNTNASFLSLNVTGNTTLNTLTVGSNLTINGILTVQNVEYIQSNVTIYASESITSNLVINGNMFASNVTVGSNLAVNGAVNVAGKMTTLGLLSSSNGLTVIGTSTLSNMNTSGVITAGAGLAVPAGSGTTSIGLYTNQNIASCNPSVQQGDALLLTSGATSDSTTGLVIGPWTAGQGGTIRLSTTAVNLYGTSASVAGTFTVGSNTTLNGAATSNAGTLTVAGNTTLKGATTTNTGTFTSTGLVTANAGLTVNNGTISVGSTPAIVIDSSANGTFSSLSAKSLSNAGPLYVSGGDYRSDNNNVTTTLLSTYNNSAASNFWKIASITSAAGNSGGIDIQGSFSRCDYAYDIKFQSTASVNANSSNITAVSEVTGVLPSARVLMYYNIANPLIPVLDYYVCIQPYTRASFLFRAVTSSLSNFSPVCVYGNSNGPTLSSTYTSVYDTSTMSLVTKNVGQFSILGTLNVSSSTTLSSNLSVAGNTTLNGASTSNAGTLTVAGNTTLNGASTTNAGTLTVAGNTTLNGTTTTNAGTLIVGGNTTLNGTTTTNAGTLTVAGNTTLNGATTTNAGTLIVAGNTTLNGTTTTNAGTLIVGGNTTLNGTTTTNAGTLTVAGNTTLNGTTTTNAGTLIVGGNTTLNGTTTTNAGTLTVAGNTTLKGSITTNAGAFTSAGLLTASGGITTIPSSTATGTAVLGRTSIGGVGGSAANFGNVLSIAGSDGYADPNSGSYGNVTLNTLNGSASSMIGFIRTSNTVIGLGYGISSSPLVFGFGDGFCGTSFQPNFLSIARANGYVGIGTIAPNYPLHVFPTLANQTISNYNFLEFGSSTGTGYNNGSSAAVNISIKSEGYVVGQAFYSISDKRVKEDVIDVPDAIIDRVMNSIKPRMFKYIDKITNKDSYNAGFIAQEVEDTISTDLPVVVESHVGDIPSIMTQCTIRTDDPLDTSKKTLVGISAQTVSKITVGTPLSLRDGTFQQVYAKVVQVNLSSSEITIVLDDVTSLDHESGSQVFVYGEVVNDFKIVDHKQIAAITTAAIKRLMRNVSDLTAQNNELMNGFLVLKNIVKVQGDAIAALQSKSNQ